MYGGGEREAELACSLTWAGWSCAFASFSLFLFSFVCRLTGGLEPGLHLLRVRPGFSCTEASAYLRSTFSKLFAFSR